MPTIREIADEYSVSKSTARRWIKQCMPEVLNGSKVNLNDSQMHQLAHFIETQKNTFIRDNINMTSSYTDSQPIHGTVHETLSGAVNDAVHELEKENVVLNAKLEALEQINTVLQNQLTIANKNLEREQMTARGFWSRLGRKLLGDGQHE